MQEIYLYKHMTDKLQELTDRLYNEGLSKGKQEGEALLENARKEAEKIVADARKKAEAIKEKAEADAADYRHKIESDLKASASQAIQATKKDIENLIIAKAVSGPAAEALSDGKFVKEVILEVAKKFSAESGSDLSVILPESLKSSLEGYVSKELPAIIGKGIDVSFSKKIAGGFTIGPAGGGWFISLTDEAFGQMIGEYMRPATKKLLFG